MRAILLVAIFLCSGCMTISSKAPSVLAIGDPEPSQLGHPYSGTVKLFNEWRCFVEIFPAGFIKWNIFTPVLIIDIPLSLTADTIMLPVDLGVTSTSPRPKYSCHLHV